MKLRLLAPCCLIISCSTLHSASVSVGIGGAADTVLFETSDGAPLDQGALFIGAFDGVPALGLGFSDIQSGFIDFGVSSENFGVFGNFGTTNFVDNVVPSGGSFDFRGEQIYVLVTNSNSLASVTEFAFFTADSNADWVFPNVDDAGLVPGSDETSIILGDQNNLVAGVTSTLTIPGQEAPLNSIQLTAVPEPSSSILLLLSSAFFFQRRVRK